MELWCGVWLAFVADVVAALPGWGGFVEVVVIVFVVVLAVVVVGRAPPVGGLGSVVAAPGMNRSALMFGFVLSLLLCMSYLP